MEKNPIVVFQESFGGNMILAFIGTPYMEKDNLVVPLTIRPAKQTGQKISYRDYCLDVLFPRLTVRNNGGSPLRKIDRS